MSDVVISVENLSKHYRLGEIGGGTLQEDFARWWAGVRGRPDPLMKVDGSGAASTGDLWALRDVSFEVRQGDVLGIIGRNGAGKSTLLKILSRTTAPTTGRVGIKGRIASLLEVGTGFHPELTGRENIFLNGAILGMKKAETARKLDEIIDFSGVERFIDTPVKRYSSGMYVRLAFAVAAHLEPEILIIDEVLAVGDAEFQNKCLGKMHQVSRGGRTVLFVSHNMGAISQLCTRGIYLDAGKLRRQGRVDECVTDYLSSNSKSRISAVDSRSAVPGQKLRIKAAGIVGNVASDGVVDNAGEMRLEVNYEVLSTGSSYAIAAELTAVGKGTVLSTSSLDSRPILDLGDHLARGDYVASVKLPIDLLLDGQYTLQIAATKPGVEILDDFPHILSFTVYDSSSPVAVLGEGRRGMIAPRLQWSVTRSGS